MNSRIASWLGLLAVASLLMWQLWSEQPLGRLSGQVLMPDGRPLAGARVWANGKESGAWHRYTDTDAEGRFRFRRVETGPFELTVGSRWHEGRMEGRVAEAAETRLTVRLRRENRPIEIAESRQSVYTTGETPRIPIQAYADGPGYDVAIWRMDADRFLANPAAYDLLERLNSTWEAPLAKLPAALAPRGRPAIAVRLPFPKADAEGHVMHRIVPPLPRNARGLWMARIGTTKGVVWTWLLVTDIAVVVKRPDADANALAYVVDQRSGLPVSGAEVTRVVDRGADRKSVV